MLRALIAVCLILSGCSNIGVSVWSEDKYSCPDSDYDNGGNVELRPGYCKSGRGIFLSYETKVN
jgi:hypothetical protein